ncbi:hypothetical protein FHS29_007316 [Saccharothrix tamanrassetensis]|uniref:DUF6292 domain-containing protein n=1 Tax=Saccharothrix tamanrassetensis TaxID=1051531 RepID=A0A841CX30_9PSEU|nr:DUF6292 family protein [Saccharothrix tamanrassetensis]MBB5960688.1 hypothetical protein [Saccharothrix tamanrassetensis]
MDEDFDDMVALRLRRYISRVTAALGLDGESSFIDAGPPANAYLALDGRIPAFPDLDVALLWDEEYGWSAALETDSGQELVVVAYLQGELVPPPTEVARFVTRLLSGERPGEPRRVRLATVGSGHLRLTVGAGQPIAEPAAQYAV